MAWSVMKPQKTELALVFHNYKRTHKHTKSSYAHKEGLRAFIRKGGKSMGVYVDGGSLTVVVCAGVLEKDGPANILTLLLELGAVFFLI